VIDLELSLADRLARFTSASCSKGQRNFGNKFGALSEAAVGDDALAGSGWVDVSPRTENATIQRCSRCRFECACSQLAHFNWFRDERIIPCYSIAGVCKHMTSRGPFRTQRANSARRSGRDSVRRQIKETTWLRVELRARRQVALARNLLADRRHRVFVGWCAGQAPRNTKAMLGCHVSPDGATPAVVSIGRVTGAEHSLTVLRLVEPDDWTVKTAPANIRAL